MTSTSLAELLENHLVGMNDAVSGTVVCSCGSDMSIDSYSEHVANAIYDAGFTERSETNKEAYQRGYSDGKRK